MADTFQAFFTVEVGGSLGPTSYRAGYRCGETGNVVCALELPASIVETTILSEAKLTIAVTTDGHVRYSVCGLAIEDNGTSLPFFTQPIDELIAQSVAVDNLHLEEVTSADLNALLQRLQRSIVLVQAAMETL